PMRVFVFDLLPYAEHLDHLKNGKELPWPLPRRHFKPEVAVRTYAEHLATWEAMDRLGYDGVGFNEHHTSPYGLMNSPNLLAAAAAQPTQRLKLLVYGNLLPLHDPLRLAEELAMLDCMSNGRIVSGFARGIPREHVRRGQQGPGGARGRAVLALLQPDAVQPRQHLGGRAPARRRLSELSVVRLRAPREPARGVRRSRALSRHDDGGRRARGRAVAVGDAGRGR